MDHTGLTPQERKADSDDLRVGPFIHGLVALGVSGMLSITLIVICVRPVETAVVAAGLVITFCGTVIAGVLTLTKLNEVRNRMNGRLDELLEITSQQKFDAGFHAGEEHIKDSTLNGEHTKPEGG